MQMKIEEPGRNQPVQLMEVSKNDSVLTPIWNQYEAAVAVYDNRGKKAIGTMERYDFYEASKQAFAIIATSEKALYANIILQKGVL